MHAPPHARAARHAFLQCTHLLLAQRPADLEADAEVPPVTRATRLSWSSAL
jgi:hypothetical protein